MGGGRGIAPDERPKGMGGGSEGAGGTEELLLGSGGGGGPKNREFPSKFQSHLEDGHKPGGREAFGSGGGGGMFIMGGGGGGIGTFTSSFFVSTSTASASV